MANKSIGQILVKDKVITEDQLKNALDSQKTIGEKLGNLLIESGVIDEKTFYQYLAKQLQLNYIDLAHYTVDANAARQLPENVARRLQVIYLGDQDNKATIGMVNPSDIFATDELMAFFKKPLQIVLVGAKELIHSFDSIYRRSGEISEFADKLAVELQDAPKSKEAELIKQADPVVTKLLNSLFEDAVQVSASDIHIEPAESILRFRLRVDGLLQEQTIPISDRHIPLAVSQRLKLMAGLNIAERRLPQDGRFDIKIRNQEIDVRMSTMPTQHGESIVMRLLNKSTHILDLDTTGMPKKMLERFRTLIKLPYGILLVTGPTGSGKTTTLYGALSEINEVTKNIVTIEDPIEYRLPRINQVQVNTTIGLAFATVLRATLRQDPNIILVGEIRDQETATIAMRAALTGHLVFATLHTNDAASTAIRLIDIGVEGYLVAATVRAVMAQRLMRVICNSCIKEYQPSDLERNFFENFFPEKFKNSTFKIGAGCSHCNNTGFKGRTGVYELLELDAKMRDALRRHDAFEFMDIVNKNRTTPSLLENAFDMARDGVSTLQEVLRVAGEQF
jgi:MSHA biogenesis protein MshE